MFSVLKPDVCFKTKTDVCFSLDYKNLPFGHKAQDSYPNNFEIPLKSNSTPASFFTILQFQILQNPKNSIFNQKNNNGSKIKKI